MSEIPAWASAAKSSELCAHARKENPSTHGNSNAAGRRSQKLSAKRLPQAIALNAPKNRKPWTLMSEYCSTHAEPRGIRTMYGRTIPTTTIRMRMVFTCVFADQCQSSPTAARDGRWQRIRRLICLLRYHRIRDRIIE